MKVYVEDNNNVNRQKNVIVEHNDEKIYWDFNSAYKNIKALEYDIFDHINQYFSRLETRKLDVIFSLYKQIKQIFNDETDTDKLTDSLTPVVSQLGNQIDIVNIRHWIMNKSDVLIPNESVIKIDYVSSPDFSGTRDQTYIRDDYIELISLCMLLRIVLPVWGEYIGRVYVQKGTKFKEQDAFRLISESKIMHCPAMHKLRVYVEYATVIGKKKMSSIIDGVSSEDFPNWILSLVVIKRLCVIDFRGIDNTTSIPSQIYGFISQRVKSLDTKSSGSVGIIKKKEFKEDSQGEQNISLLESYKAKQEIAPGDIVALEIAASDIDFIIKRLQPDIDIELLTNALKTSEVLNTQRLYNPQLTLMQQVLKDVIPVRSTDHLLHKTIVKLLAVVQAVLWHRGHKDLAALATAVVLPTNDEMYVSTNDSRSQIPKEMIDELDTLFPFKKRPPGRQKNVKLVNQAVTSINILSEQFSSYNWQLTLDTKYLSEIAGVNGQRRYYIPRNFKIMLASLVLDIVKLKS